MSDSAHAAPQSFITKYIFSTDHKVVAKQYLFTGMFMGLLGGFLAYVIRMQLTYPGQPVPGYGPVNFLQYNSVVTMHGTIMLFWVAMPVLLAALGNFLIPLMIGARDMAFPKLNMLSYWIFFLSSVVLIASFFVPGGAANGGWTSYPPLSSSKYSGGQWGMTLWLIAVALEFAAFLLGGINFITTALNMRAPGMKLLDMPIMVWMQIVAAVVFMLSVGPLVAGAIMLFLDRVVGTGFFDPAQGGDPLLFQHLFWFFGHPEVYVVLLPGLGVISEVLPVFSRKTIFGYKMIVYATLATGAMSFLVWAHHQFIAGIDPRLAIPFSITTILISVPVAVTTFSFMATLWKGKIRFTTPMCFAIGMIALFLVGGVTGIHNGAPAANMFLHDTYFIVAHFHYTLIPQVFFAFFAAFYFWFPKMFGSMLNEVLGKLHFLGTFVFMNVTFLPMFVLGFMGHQRRIANPQIFDTLHNAQVQHLHLIATIGALGLLLSQLIFFVNLTLSLVKRKAPGNNPWHSNTLEWATTSPPGHGNFETPPVVYRGPYEYSVPGASQDYLPQNMPPK